MSNSDGNGILPGFELSGDIDLLVVSADGSLLASSSSGEEVTVLQFDGEQLTKLSSFVKGQAESLSFHPHGTLLAVGTSRNVFLMDVESGKEVARIPHLSTVNGVSFSTDGSYLVTTSSQALQFWAGSEIQQVKSEDLITATCSYLIENFSPAQWRTFFGDDTYEPICQNLESQN